MSSTATRLADIRQAIALAHDYRLKVVVFGGAEAWAAANDLAAGTFPSSSTRWRLCPITTTVWARGPTMPRLLARRRSSAWPSAYRRRASTAAGMQVPRCAKAPVSRSRRAFRTRHASALRSRPEPPSFWASRNYWVACSGSRGRSGHLGRRSARTLERAEMVMIDGENVSPVTRQTLLRDRYAPRH